MRLFLFILLLLAVHQTSAQEKYRCTYTTISKIPPASRLRDTLMNQLRASSVGGDVEVTEEMIIQFVQDIMDQLSTIRANLTAAVFNDSTVITPAVSSAGDGYINLNVRTHPSVWKYRTVVNQNTREAHEIPDSDMKLIKTGNKRTILEREAFEYANAGKTVFVWVVPKLPPGINPGIPGIEVPGAIFAFEIKTAGKERSGTITELQEFNN